MELAYTYWENEGWFLGYLNDYPDHWTQGKTLPELEEMLADLYAIFQRNREKPTTIEKKTGVLTVSA